MYRDRVLVDLLHDGVHQSTWLWQVINMTLHLLHGGTMLLNGHQVTLHLTDLLLQFTLQSAMYTDAQCNTVTSMFTAVTVITTIHAET